MKALSIILVSLVSFNAMAAATVSESCKTKILASSEKHLADADALEKSLQADAEAYNQRLGESATGSVVIASSMAVVKNTKSAITKLQRGLSVNTLTRQEIQVLNRICRKSN